MRRALIKYASGNGRPKTAAIAVEKLAHRLHRHCCTTCRMTYTDSCDVPAENARCHGCRTDHGRALWDQNHDPQPCCVTAQQILEPDEILRYSLAGTGPWYRCGTCGRSNGFIPREETT